MGILRVDHPDIEEFIFAKHNGDQITSFNLSIAVTDAFMHAVVSDAPFDLKWEDRVYRTIRARDLWETIMRSTWDWAEPGVLFIDRINEENNLSYCEVICATNPCSEQPLPPFGACLLGSFNLAAYLRPKSKLPVLASERFVFDWKSFADHIPVIVRAMDNVIECALYPLKEQQNEAIMTRRMGLGIMGTANCLEACGAAYGSQEFIREMDFALTILKNEAYYASARLAKEKGAFPRFARERYLERPFIKRLSPKVQAEIAEHGIRNSHLISIAPTGTISFCMDNISSGIEPVFAARTRRRVRGLGEVDVVDYGIAKLGVQPKTAAEVTAGEHISVLCAAQKHVDSAVSKTCNVSAEMPWEDFKDLYFLAWRNGAKGCATFQNGGKRKGVMEALPVTNCIGDRCEPRPSGSAKETK
jgi:ribonucleoside-diphosphate reductase alpha chain